MTRLAPAGGGGLSAPRRPASARPAFPRLNLLRRALFLWAAPCLVLAGGCRSVPPLPPPPSSLVELETRMEALRLRFAIPGMTAAAARGGDLLWAKGFGTADREAGTAASVDTVYHLASLTKPFAAAVLLQLVEEGRLDLDAPVAKFGVAVEEGEAVRVRHLLSHTSRGEPGRVYRYSGSRFALLDRVLKSVTGQGLAELLRERLLGPLSLDDTSPNPEDAASCQRAGRDPARFRLRLARGYDPSGTKPVEYPKYFGAAAGLVSTVGDVVRFSAALDEGRVLKPATRELAFSPAIAPGGRRLPYGLGWFVQDFQGERLVWHYGWWTGISALIVKAPARRLTVVVLASSDGLSREFALQRGDVLRSPFARELLSAFLRGPLAAPPVGGTLDR